MGLKEYDARMKICRECPQLKIKLTGPYCIICGCNVKAKSSFPNQSCPLGKW